VLGLVAINQRKINVLVVSRSGIVVENARNQIGRSTKRSVKS
jgi:hypothetical protein